MIPFLSLFFAGFAARPIVAEDFPRALVEFQAIDANPVFTAGGPGQWDAKIRERGWIMHENGIYRLWYTGYVRRPEGPMSLGYATSTDGIHWERHPQNPIYDAHWIEDMMIVRDGATLYMFAEGKNDQSQLLSSTDGIHWNRLGKIDVRLVNGSPIPPGPYGTPTALKVGGTWNLFYERFDKGIWRATSTDMVTWTNVSDDPVLLPGPGAYDSRLVAMDQIISRDGRFYAYYHGLGETPNEWCSCVAVSADLTKWEKYARNPLFPARENKSSPVLVDDGKSLRLYTMHDRVALHLPAPAESARSPVPSSP